MPEAGELSATLEDYLEAICQLTDNKGMARVRDIADTLSVHKSTVTAALRGLAEKGLVNYSPYEIATITAHGRRHARDVMKRHGVIQRFLVEVLGIEASLAAANACRIEHAIDGRVLDRLLEFLDLVQDCPCGGRTGIQECPLRKTPAVQSPSKQSSAEHGRRAEGSGAESEKGKRG